MPKNDKKTKQIMSNKGSLKSLFPEIASEWHPEKNGDKNPEEFTGKSAKKVWWLCPEKHSYATSIKNRTKKKGAGCPYCLAGGQEALLPPEKFAPILIAINNDEDRTVMVNDLESDGFHVETSPNAKDALKKFKVNEYCLVISNDIELLEEIEAISPQKPLIFPTKDKKPEELQAVHDSKLNLLLHFSLLLKLEEISTTVERELFKERLGKNEVIVNEDTIILKPNPKKDKQKDKQRDKQRDWGSFLEAFDIPFRDKEDFPTTPPSELEKRRFNWELLAKLGELNSGLISDYPLSLGKFPSEEKDLLTSKNEIKEAKRFFKKCLLKEGMTEGEDFIENKSTSRGKAKKVPMLPEFIIKLPNNKVILAECKLSLKPYEEYLNADNEDDKARAEASFLELIKKNIAYLSSERLRKFYDEEYGHSYHIYLFFPIENAIYLACSLDSNLKKFLTSDWESFGITFVSPAILATRLLITKSTYTLALQTIEADEKLAKLEERIEIQEITFQEKNEDYKKLMKRIEEKDKELLLRRQESILKDQKLKKFINENQHAISNSLFPHKINKVAEELYKHGGFEKSVRTLRQSFNAMLIVKQKTELLTIQATAGSKKLERLILSERLPENSPETAVTVPEILNKAAEYIIEQRLLNQDDIKLEKSRSHLINKSKADIGTLCDDFEKNVIFNNEMTPLEWIDLKMAKTIIGNLTPTWGEIFLRKDGYAHHYLHGQWGELLFNAFKYADLSQNNFLKITFEEKNINDSNWLQMIWENSCVESKETIKRSGLEGIAESLKNLNNTNDEKFSLYVETKKDFFVVTLNYNSDILVANTESLF